MLINKKYTYPAIFSILAVLLPAHPSVQELFVSYGIPSILVSIGLFILAFFSGARFQLTHTFFAVFLSHLLFLAVISVGLMRSPVVAEDSWNKVFISLFFVTSMVIVCAFIASQNRDITLRIISVLSFVVLIHVVIIIFYQESFSGFISLNSDKENPNYQSTSFYLGLLAIGLVIRLCTFKAINLLLTLIFFTSILLVMSLVGARSAFLALLSTTIISLYLLNRLRLYVVTFSLMISGLFIVYVNQEIIDNILIVQRFASLGEGDSSSRVYLFTSAVRLWLYDICNVLFGSGIGYYPIFIDATEPGWYPHNFLLEVLAEAGVIGLFPLLFILFLFFWGGNHAFKNRDMTGCIIFLYGLYALLGYQFMGGLNSLWLPMFFIYLSIFSTLKIKRKALSD